MKKTIFGTFAIAIGIIIGVFVQSSISGDNIYKEMEKYNTVFNNAYKNYVDEVSVNDLTEGALKGMLKELDVHSVYIPPEEKKKVDEDFQGHFHGIGVQFDILQDSITVISPLSGGPSEKLGILAGDKIVQIDGENAVGIPRGDVPKRLKGPKGTLVTVDVKRMSVDTLLHFEIIRDKIPTWSLGARFIIDGTDVGYMSFNRFNATTHNEMMEAIEELRAQGMKKLVLDLRYNPGGYLDQAYRMANEFLPAGDTIVYTRGRRDKFNEELISRAQGSLQDIPLAVLVNRNSASASEIVSGAIQDLDRGLVIGETSFGKGLVQRQYTLYDGSAYRITISRYYTPSGRSIQRPFEDSKAYQSLVGRIDLEDGQKMEDAIEKLRDFADSTGKDLDSMLYKTRHGRTVFAGGGITPDYIVKEERLLKESTAKMRVKRVFTIFADFYLNNDGNFVKEEYSDNFLDFLNDYELNDRAWEELREFADKNDIEWNEEEFEEDKDYIQNYVKSNMANIIWGRHESRQVSALMDKQLKAAIDLMPEAEKLMSLK